MQPSGSLRIINKTPIILITNKDLARIKYIVDLAPQEAQWFHRVERKIHEEYIFYHIYEMYIPEQYCSAAEVDTDPMMMMNFYKDLKKKHGDNTNEIMSNMTCWSHSHHNMGVNPSRQDNEQFKTQVELASKQNKTDPQLMMIFNKKNKYYCRLWDPELSLMFENPNMETIGYDFSDVKEQAKVKFKKKIVTIPQRKHTFPGSSYPYATAKYPLGYQGHQKYTSTVSKANTPDQNTLEYFQRSKALNSTPTSGAKKNLRAPRKTNEKEESSFDGYKNLENATKSLDISKILELIEKANHHKDENVCQDLITELTQLLTDEEMVILEILLCSKEDEILELIKAYPEENIEETNDATTQLYLHFLENTTDENSLGSAIALAKMLGPSSTTNITQAEELLKNWIADYVWQIYNSSNSAIQYAETEVNQELWSSHPHSDILY